MCENNVVLGVAALNKAFCVQLTSQNHIVSQLEQPFT